MNPGDHVVVKDFTLVRKVGSDEEHYTERMQNGLIVQLSHLWHELGSEAEPQPTYLVLFSREMKLYYVPADGMLTPDQATDPSRLFGRLRG